MIEKFKLIIKYEYFTQFLIYMENLRKILFLSFMQSNQGWIVKKYTTQAQDDFLDDYDTKEPTTEDELLK